MDENSHIIDINSDTDEEYMSYLAKIREEFDIEDKKRIEAVKNMWKEAMEKADGCKQQ